MLRSKDLQNDQLEHLNFSKNFKIEFNNERGIIIFGFNGIGKTSIAKFLADEKDDCFYLDVDYQSKSEFVKNNRSFISINTEIDEILNLEQELESLKVNNTKDFFKSKDLTNQTKSRNISTKFDQLRKDINNWPKSDGIDYKLTTPKKKLREMAETFGEHDTKILSNVSKIKKLDEAETEFEKYKQSLKLRLANEVEKMYNLDEQDLHECPLCNSKIDSLKEILEERKQEIAELKTTLNEDNVLSKYTQEDFEALCEMVETLDDKEIVDYILTDGDPSRVDVWNDDIDRYNALKMEVASKRALAEENFEAIKKVKPNVEGYLSQRFKEFKNIDLNENNNSVIINFNKSIDHLSTGQLNLILFITELYKFEGSTKTTLIMDDPLSSFDLCNQYKIVFEIIEKIVKNQNGAQNKKYLVFTHNIELLNISRNQIQNNFISYFVLDSINDELVISDKIGMNEAYFGLKTFHNINNPYINLMIKRETNLDAEENRIFHYHGKYEWNNLSNTELLQSLKIDTLNHSQPYDFINVIKNKILKLLALRIYVEKKLYDAIEDKTPLNNFETLPIGKKLIKYFDEEGELYRDINQKYPTLDRKSLMNKKVTLNQHSHFQGQISPLNYALNISLDDLDIEIKEVKEMFNDPDSTELMV